MASQTPFSEPARSMAPELLTRHLPGEAAAAIIASAALNGFETSADVLLPWLPKNEAAILLLRLLESLTLRSISAELGACRTQPHRPLLHRRPPICPDPSDSKGSGRKNGA